MAKSTCSIEGCDRPQYARGWCRLHYERNRKYGDPMVRYPPRRVRRPIVRFWEYVPNRPPGECWTWTGNIKPDDGYGRFGVTNRNYPAHRWLYMYLHGPLPLTLDVDHLCHNADPNCRGSRTCLHRRCVNPAHLEAVSRQVNTLRGKTRSGANARKTHCPRGHAYDVIEPNRRGCSVCIKAHNVAGAIRRRERRVRQMGPEISRGGPHGPV